MKNLIVRSISGIIYVALIVAAILSRVVTDWGFLTVFSLFIALGIHEVHHIAKCGERHSPTLLQLIDIAGGISLFITAYIQISDLAGRVMWLIPIASYFLVRTIIQLYMPRHNALVLIMRSALAISYIALPIAMLHGIVVESNSRMILAMFIFIWAFDSGAYMVGSTIGKHRLFERISPKKSWEGVAGGILVSMLIAWLLYQYCNDFFCGPMQLTYWLIMSVTVSVFATLGDLFESLLKRTAGLKDSGNIIPGHGGILDRIDSLIFVSPAILILFIIFNLSLM